MRRLRWASATLLAGTGLAGTVWQMWALPYYTPPLVFLFILLMASGAALGPNTEPKPRPKLADPTRFFNGTDRAWWSYWVDGRWRK
jgi:hypothetical protein